MFLTYMSALGLLSGPIHFSNASCINKPTFVQLRVLINSIFFLLGMKYEF